MKHHGYSPILAFLGLFLSVTLLGGCSLNKLVMNKISDAVSGSGASTVFTGDDDPQLVADALPFAIKMYETLLEQNPNHQGLLLTTGSLYVMYANAFVQGPADMLPMEQWQQKSREIDRAKNLYLRGVAILERGIHNKYPGMIGQWGPEESSSFDAGLSKMKKEDVSLFYWYAAGTLSAYALNVFDIGLGLRVPRLTQMMLKAYELDENYANGALDEFFFLLYSALPEGMGGDRELALVHFQKAIEKTKGLAAGPYVAYAQSISVQNQDYEDFIKNLETALEIDPKADPNNVLVNTINQRKARYLLERVGDLFADFNDEAHYGDGEW